jgi:hypothetical protein
MEEFEEILKDIQRKESEDKEFEIWLRMELSGDG